MMNQDYPQLTLDDLVHIMSPSPAPQALQDDSDGPLHIERLSPEPLPETDIVQMRRKVTEMRHIDKSDAQLTPREQELAEMVLRLTAVMRPDSDQFFRQAEVISTLIQQRDLLLHQAEEQRLRWNSEKDGWDRMAEALLAQQTKSRLNQERDEDHGRLHVVEADNKGLRQRLYETQSRLQMLESELTRLRPLLLMQPLISRASVPPPTPNPKSHYTRRRRKDATTTEDEEHDASEDEPLMDPLDTPSHAAHSQVTPRAKIRKSEAPNPPTNIHKRRPHPKSTARGLSADARVEHLLLAARKIGKHRAGIMSGLVRHVEEQEKERGRDESATMVVATTPKTPKRSKTHAGYPVDGGYVYMNGRMQPGMQPVPLFIPAYPHLLQTPSSSTTAPSVTSSTQKTKPDAKSNNPPTPLDSLLSAARSMMCEDTEADEDEDVDVLSDSPGQAAGIRIAASKDVFGSPVPKRRKVVPCIDKLTGSSETSDRATGNASTSVEVGFARVRSGLDVLADQAAAFSTQELSVVSSQAKGEKKDRIDTQLQDPSSSTPNSRGRPKSKGKAPNGDTPFSVSQTSRSRTPRSDLGDTPTGSTVADVADETPSRALDDPGGGTSGANVSNPLSSQTVDTTPDSKTGQAATIMDVHSPRLSTPLSQDNDEPEDATPRQGSCIQVVPGDGDGRAAVTISDLVTLVASPRQQLMETIPPRGGKSGSGPIASMAKNKELVRVAEQDTLAPTPPAKRQRSPYVKWSKEEDDLLAQAVAKYGQKWDLVQKALPSRGYHQVRQRWLRKLGVFDSKPDLSSFQTATATFASTQRGDGAELRGNPKLGLAPLSSERALSGLAGKSPSMPL